MHSYQSMLVSSSSSIYLFVGRVVFPGRYASLILAAVKHGSLTVMWNISTWHQLSGNLEVTLETFVEILAHATVQLM